MGGANAFPSIAYVEWTDEFRKRFLAKVVELNSLATKVMASTGVNAKYMPPDGFSPSVLLWSYVMPMAIGLGLGVVASRGLNFGAIEAHVDRLTLSKAAERLLLDKTTRFLQHNLLANVRASFQKLRLSAGHLGRAPDRATVDFARSRVGGYLADYLCTVGLRALNTTRPEKMERRWLSMLNRWRGTVATDVSHALLQPLPPIRS